MNTREALDALLDRHGSAAGVERALRQWLAKPDAPIEPPRYFYDVVRRWCAGEADPTGIYESVVLGAAASAAPQPGGEDAGNN